MAAEIDVGGWHEDVVRITSQAVVNATPDLSTQQTVPAESIPVEITFEYASQDVVTQEVFQEVVAEVVPPVVEPAEVPTVPTVPELPVVPTVPTV